MGILHIKLYRLNFLMQFRPNKRKITIDLHESLKSVRTRPVQNLTNPLILLNIIATNNTSTRNRPKGGFLGSNRMPQRRKIISSCSIASFKKKKLTKAKWD